MLGKHFLLFLLLCSVVNLRPSDDSCRLLEPNYKSLSDTEITEESVRDYLKKQEMWNRFRFLHWYKFRLDLANCVDKYNDSMDLWNHYKHEDDLEKITLLSHEFVTKNYPMFRAIAVGYCSGLGSCGVEVPGFVKANDDKNSSLVSIHNISILSCRSSARAGSVNTSFDLLGEEKKPFPLSSFQGGTTCQVGNGRTYHVSSAQEDDVDFWSPYQQRATNSSLASPAESAISVVGDGREPLDFQN